MDKLSKLWKEVGWETVQARVEMEIGAIGDRQQTAEEGKKVLLEESNRYRKNTDKEQRRVAVPLIKAFQKEVDQLSVRSKVTEAALIDICQKLVGLPDPAPFLDQASIWHKRVESAERIEQERDELKQNIQELHREFSDLENQDVTIRQLRERIKQLESEKTVEVENSAQETERAVREECAENEREMSARTDALRHQNGVLEKKVSELEARMKDAQRRLDSARLDREQKEALGNEQIEILEKDLEDANRRISSFEVEVSRLTSELANAKTATPARTGLEDIAALGSMLKERDDQISRLTDENRSLRERVETDGKKVQKKVDEIQKEVERYAMVVESLNAELAKRADYDQIQQELRVLRQMEFGSGLSEDGGEVEVASSLEGTMKTLENLLVEKNKKIQGDNALLRANNEQMKVPSLSKHHSSSGKMAVRDVSGKQAEKQGNKKPPVIEQNGSLEEKEEEQQTLFNILLNSMGGGASSSVTLNPLSIPLSPLSREESEERGGGEGGETMAGDDAISQLSQEMGVKISNYTGEQPKRPSEIRAINELSNQIASNVRNLGPKALNTAEVARQCKRLMLAYNIGQRLFAKYVMNQSQGSLSELLSKPRHWGKLTDKGREAFRRIYAWISDTTAIQLLCQLSPRRITPDDIRLDHPTPESLWECNSGSTVIEQPDENYYQKRSSGGATSAKEDQYRSAGTSAASRGSSRWRHDDIPKEKVIAIFQNELAKLREQESTLERAINKSTGGTSTSTGSLRRLEDLAYGGVTTQGLPSKHAQQVMSARMKCGLQPITQDQFEYYGVINTEEVVRQIKDFLTVNTISQRQFGEYVLGLSQGSVSDLLARPKSWHMLTQKGREPFIRMKLFMEDVTKAAEEGLKNEGNGGEKGSPHSSSSSFMNDHNLSPSHSLSPSASNERASSIHRGNTMATATAEAVMGDDVEILFLPVVKTEIDEDACVGQYEDPSNALSDLSSLFSAHPNYEEMGDEMDTVSVVRKVKDRLHLHGISQRLFGEVIVGVSAGVCSDLFIRPRKWATLTKKGREPYERMAMWLEDRDGPAKLIAHDRGVDIDELRPVSNGKRHSEDDSPFEVPPKKMQRTVITDSQKEALKFVFAHDQHPSQRTNELLANKLGLHIRTVNNWFHNYRTRQKASLKEGKLLPCQLPSVDQSRDWKKDLVDMLDAHERHSTEEPSSPLKLGDLLKTDNSSILDRAVEKMRQMAAASVED